MKLTYNTHGFSLKMQGLLAFSMALFLLNLVIAVMMYFSQSTLSQQPIGNALWSIALLSVLSFAGVVVTMALSKQSKAVLGDDPSAIKALSERMCDEHASEAASVEKGNSVASILLFLQNALQKQHQHQAVSNQKIEDRLYAYSQQLSVLTEYSGVLQLSADGFVIAINKVLLDILGYSEAEALGQPYEKLFGGAAFMQANNSQWSVIKQGAPLQTLQCLNKNGQTVWLKARYQPILNRQGELLHVEQYSVDVTAEHAFRAHADLLNMVVNENNIAATVTDPEGRVIFVNKGFTELTGYRFDEIKGKKPGELLQGEYSAPETVQAIRDALKQQAAIECEIINYTKAGTPYWINLKINPVFDEHGMLIKYVSLQSNIDEVKLKTLETNARLAAISKSMAIIELGLDGHVLTANENFCDTCGYTLEEIAGQHHSLFVSEDVKETEEYQQFWQKLNRGEFDTGQYERIHKNGSHFWLQASYNPVFDLYGNPIKVVKFAMDVTASVKQSHALGRAVDEIQNLVMAAKACDISNRLNQTSDVNEIRTLYDGVNMLVDNMSEVILHLEEAGDTIGAVAHQISEGNGDLAERTDQQLDQIEDTAQKMDKLASTIWENAENAKTASGFATEASDVAVKGGDMVADVINTMAIINDSSRKIEDIISVIDGIAFQTNILALNAAVEAARAGDQGKGFAVVAGEVRNLAQRSADAAKEIKSLISDSVTNVQEGVRLVQDAGITMEHTVNAVKRVTKVIGEITENSFEQGLSVAQLNNMVSNMKIIGQQNNDLVKRIANSVGQLLRESSAVTSRASEYQIALESRNRFAAEQVECSLQTDSTNVVSFPQHANTSTVELSTAVKEKKLANESAAPSWILF